MSAEYDITSIYLLELVKFLSVNLDRKLNWKKTNKSKMQEGSNVPTLVALNCR